MIRLCGISGLVFCIDPSARHHDRLYGQPQPQQVPRARQSLQLPGVRPGLAVPARFTHEPHPKVYSMVINKSCYIFPSILFLSQRQLTSYIKPPMILTLLMNLAHCLNLVQRVP